MDTYKLIAVAALFTLLAGCQGGSPFDYVPVSGQVTFEDGDIIPAKGMKLQFATVDIGPKGDMYPRPATASLDAQGRFNYATSYKHADGLVPGRHKVAIGYAKDAKGKLLIPKECTHLSTTPLVVDTDELPLKILVPRP